MLTHILGEDFYFHYVPRLKPPTSCEQLYGSLPVFISEKLQVADPRCSMYGIFTYIYPQNYPNVGK